jgi:hypothetical protein
MKIIVADIYALYIHNSKNTRFPKEFKKYKIMWNMRDVLLEIWQGKVTEIAVSKLGTPGYDFPDFARNMVEIGQIKNVPKITYYELDIAKNK